MANKQKTKGEAVGWGADPRSNTEQEITDLPEGELTKLAHELWQARGCPVGSPDEDWFRAEEQLRSRHSKGQERLKAQE